MHPFPRHSPLPCFLDRKTHAGDRPVVTPGSRRPPSPHGTGSGKASLLKAEWACGQGGGGGGRGGREEGGGGGGASSHRGRRGKEEGTEVGKATSLFEGKRDGVHGRR